MRTARRRTRIAAGARETVGVGEIYSESSAGPEVGPINSIVDDDLPPVETPLLRPFSLLFGLPNDAFGVLDDLVGADGALPRIPRVIDLPVFAEGGFDNKEGCEDADCAHYRGKYETEPPQHEHRKSDRHDDGERRSAIG